MRPVEGAAEAGDGVGTAAVREACAIATAALLLATASAAAQAPTSRSDSSPAVTPGSSTTSPARSAHSPANRGISRADTAARGFEVSGTPARTRVLVELTNETAPVAFLLSDPWRVVTDLADAELAHPAGGQTSARGLVKGLRAGLFAPGKLRVVIDTTGPVGIETARVLPATPDGGPRLELVLVPASPTALRAADIASAAQSFSLDTNVSPDAAAPRRPKSRPVVVIDAGHGGIDPGAQGSQGIEKDVVLAVATEVQRALATGRRYDIVMTRTSDVFVSLDERVEVSRRHQADLFLSIHADALDIKSQPQSVRGATIYTLAEKASDARAKAMADKENAADLLAGLPAAAADDDDQVRNILFDLMRRESANFSTDFRKLLVGEMRPRVKLARDPYRSAPFKVLRQPGSPAVLIELGYISNIDDEKLMLTETWQRSVALAIARAVDNYFKRRRAEAR